MKSMKGSKIIESIIQEVNKFQDEYGCFQIPNDAILLLEDLIKEKLEGKLVVDEAALRSIAEGYKNSPDAEGRAVRYFILNWILGDSE